MSKQEAINIKDEILKKEGSIHICNAITIAIDGVVLIKDILDIIDKHTAESEDKCKNCEYYRNPDYTRCHKCKAESEEE